MSGKSWIEKLLRKLPNISLPENIEISAFNNWSFNKVVDEDQSKLEVDNKTQTLNFYIVSSDIARIKPLLSELPEMVSGKQKFDVLSAEWQELEVGYLEAVNNNQKLLNYFSGILPALDMRALKASLVLKRRLEQGLSTHEIKRKIVITYGKRGSVISNLCSAGYFETWIKPLYEEMRKAPAFSRDRFLKVYIEIVDKHPFALFVNTRMTVIEVGEKIDLKIQQARERGISEINVHGIGSENIKTITEAVEKYKEDPQYKLVLDHEDRILVVKIAFLELEGDADLQVWSGSEWKNNVGGPTFADIYPEWSEIYDVAIRNTGTVNLKMYVNSEWRKDKSYYAPDNLRDHISVEVWERGSNNSGPVNYLGKYGSLRDWISNSTGFQQANQLDAGEQRWYRFRFTADDLDDSYQNKVMRNLNFVFDGTTEGATQK